MINVTGRLWHQVGGMRYLPPYAGVAELADAQDLKSCDPEGSCGFDPRPAFLPNIPTASERPMTVRPPRFSCTSQISSLSPAEFFSTRQSLVAKRQHFANTHHRGDHPQHLVIKVYALLQQSMIGVEGFMDALPRLSQKDGPTPVESARDEDSGSMVPTLGIGGRMSICSSSRAYFKS